MQQRGIPPNAFNFVGILKAFVSNRRAIQRGRKMHVEIERKGLLDEHMEHEQDWLERLLIFT